ncbi:CRISPR-associated protein Cas4 [Zavarzinia aquatilis]|uniref:CRISPR-associated exonuclease Cas4 n=1 Tax=Zavarzinia aquatilis TaxID=2211142 RepID=A0A317ECJ7_9PROT|nr:CRISPR-associated protein Cas4 [Zavarzinia aquatilis]PWR24352.1 CRISPR-associated protein Cas4 [Zavarzinia aquatilis]
MEDEDFIPLSALQHFVFCPRQCALIHLEQAWADNRLTAEGNLLHERVTGGETSLRAGIRAFRSLPLRCGRLGLVGYADVVEFEAGSDTPFPVEYKRGRAKPHDADRVQLCAQALCIEEMTGLPVPEGALFYGEPRRREATAFTPALRARTEQAAAELRALLASGRTPAAEPGPKCRNCSLAEICRPTLSAAPSAARWVERLREEA